MKEGLVNVTATPGAAEQYSLSELQANGELWDFVKDDPITVMLLTGEAKTVHEAEVKFLNENVDFICDEVVRLSQSDLTEDELALHPLVILLRSHGSRPWEDSLL
jgi:hypothetical protein